MDKKFYDAHPPLITSADEEVPDRSDYGIVGILKISDADMNRVIDPRYPWRDYADGNSPAYRKKALQIIAERDAAVGSYTVTRQRYWLRKGRWHYGADQQVRIILHSGYIEHHSHITEQSHTTVERIAADLGINLSAGGAELPGGLPPIPPAAIAADAAGGGGAGGGGDGSGSGGNLGLHFSQEMTDTLHITDSDDQTYTDEKTVETTQDFKADTTYAYWQMLEECVLQRYLKSAPDKPEFVYRTLVGLNWEYTDAFPGGDINGGGDTPDGGDTPGGDIH